MEIEGAGGFEDAVEFEEAVGHHGEIGHHVVLLQELSQGEHHLGHVGIVAVEEFVELALGLLSPMPGVLEGGDLRVGLVSLRRFEEHGIIALGIKRRIEIDKINRLRSRCARGEYRDCRRNRVYSWAEFCGENIVGTYPAFPPVSTAALLNVERPSDKSGYPWPLGSRHQAFRPQLRRSEIFVAPGVSRGLRFVREPKAP